jgi:hypothetical protein
MGGSGTCVRVYKLQTLIQKAAIISGMVRFWNTVLTVNSVLLAGTSVYLVYALGMLVIAFEWKQFLLTLTIWAVLVGTEMVFAGLCHE